MLLNKKESVPDKFYIFVNRLNPVTRNNFDVTKTFASAAYSQCAMDNNFAKKYIEGKVNHLTFNQSNSSDLHVISPYHLSAISDYSVEYNAELLRMSDFPTYPSRLSAIFAFGDYETCKQVSEKYKWALSDVREFKLIRSPLVRVVKVNMEIISLARYANKISSLDPKTNDLIWKSYWSGTGNIDMELPNIDFKREVKSSGVIWEYLIEGVAVAI